MSTQTTLSQRLAATIIALIASVVVSFAADAVRLPAQSIVTRGAVTAIPVTGTLSIPGTVRITMTYPANILRILSVVGGDSYLFRCNSVQIIADSILSGTTGQLTIQCSDVVAGTDAPLFDLIVEGLFNPEQSGQIIPNALIANGNDSTGAELIPGVATLAGDSPIRPTVKEGFTGNYPNPFNASSRFVFTMKQPGQVSLIIRNLQGRVVSTIGSVEVTAGENAYFFEPEAYELAQGTYVMQLTTDRGVYHHSFVVLR